MRKTMTAPPHARIRPTAPAPVPGDTIRNRGRMSRGALVGGLLLLAAVTSVWGVRVSSAMLSPPPARYSGPLAVGSGPFAVGQAFRADRAVVEITGVEVLNGLSAQDLSNANHGIQNLVQPGDAQVQVTVRLVNDGARPIDISTEAMTLKINGKRPIPATSSTLPKGRLRAGLSMEGSLGFVAPRDGSTLQLQVPATHGPLLVDLGRTDRNTSTDTTGHHH